MYLFIAKFFSLLSVGFIFVAILAKADPLIAIPLGLGSFAVACLLKHISLKKGEGRN